MTAWFKENYDDLVKRFADSYGISHRQSHFDCYCLPLE